MIKRLLMIVLFGLLITGCQAKATDYLEYNAAIIESHCPVILSIENDQKSLFISPLHPQNNLTMIEFYDQRKPGSRLGKLVADGEWKYKLFHLDYPRFVCTEFKISSELDLPYQLRTNFVGEGQYERHLSFENKTGDYILLKSFHQGRIVDTIVEPYLSFEGDILDGSVTNDTVKILKLTK
ncbi:MAG: hypothetical protein ACRCXZ_07300 [Patescibacteria group bacterium]